MRVAAIYDIHANLPALESVLEEVRQARRDDETGTIPEQYRESMRWNAQQLTAADAHVLAGWPSTVRLEIAIQAV